MPKIINTDEMEWTTFETSEKFGSKRKRIANEADPCGIGAGIFKLDPGKTAFPFHMHYAQDEAIWVLSGTGTLRYGEEKIPLKKGDYITLPKGTGNAHQFINTSDATLEFLCLSTMENPEVCIYPDSDKIAAYDFKPGDSYETCNLVEFHKRNPAGYWDDET